MVEGVSVWGRVTGDSLSHSGTKNVGKDVRSSSNIRGVIKRTKGKTLIYDVNLVPGLNFKGVALKS